MGSFKPNAEQLAILAFWWPMLAGVVLFVIPLLLFYILGIRLAAFLPLLRLRDRARGVAFGTAMGTTAFLAGPLLVYELALGIPLLIVSALLALVLAWQLGLALDDGERHSFWRILVPLTGALVAGFVLLHGASVPLLLLTAIVALPLIDLSPLKEARRRHSRNRSLDATEQNGEEKRAAPRTSEEFTARLQEPLYQHTGLVQLPSEAVIAGEVFESAALAALQGARVHYAFVGKRGAGKTALSQHLLKRFLKEAEQRGIEPQVLQGTCERPMLEEGERESFGPFQEAIREKFNINLHGNPQAQVQLVNQALGNLFGAIVPLSDMLFASAESEGRSAHSSYEIIDSIARMIEKLRNKGPVVLMIDDVQWIDPQSAELLELLMTRLPPLEISGESPGEHGFLLLLAGQEESGELLKKMHFAGEQFLMDLPDLETRVHILRYGIGLEEASASFIVDYVKDEVLHQGGMHWLIGVVQYLYREGYIALEEEGWKLKDDVLQENKLPISGGLRATLQKNLDRYPQYRRLIECAGCLGLEFRASVLAESLEIPRLDLLQDLYDIEERTGILHDVMDHDDYYAFRSSYMLDVIRDAMKLRGRGPGDTGTPQIVREYHARLASSLIRSGDHSTAVVYDVANHYYAAGHGYLAEAVEANLKAARIACTVYSLDQAESFLEHAGECAEFHGNTGKWAEEMLLLDLELAHLRNDSAGHLKMQEVGLEYLAEHADASAAVKLAVLRAVYDAALQNGADQQLFARAVELAREIERTEQDPLVRGEALHFAGRSLPLNERAGRLDALRQAQNVVEQTGLEQAESRALLARIFNSIGEELSYDKEVPVAEVAAFFERSLEIKEQKETYDLRGQAYCHGGLGRLYLFRQPPNLDLAEKHLKIDLEISCKIGDLGGQTAMNSLLGQIALERAKELEGAARQERLLQAEDRYLDSLRTCASERDFTFACRGLLNVCLLDDDLDRMASTVIHLKAVLREESAEAEGISGVIECVESFADSVEEAHPSFAKHLRLAFSEVSVGTDQERDHDGI